MPYSTVSRRSDGTHVALCSCGWEGDPRTDKNDAYRDKGHHNRDQHPSKEDTNG